MKKILVAEDEQAIREFVVINLQRAGYDVVEAENGEQALGIYQRENGNFDVAVLDIMMPGEYDGLAVCKELRKKSGTIGIIMLTARTQEMDKVTGLMMGADDYVTKPFSPSELVARVDAVYRRVALAEMRSENNFKEEIRSGGICPEPAQPFPHEAGAADRTDAGGIPDYGILFLQPRHGAGSHGNFKACVGGKLFWGRENRGCEHPPPAHEN